MIKFAQASDYDSFYKSINKVHCSNFTHDGIWNLSDNEVKNKSLFGVKSDDYNVRFFDVIREKIRNCEKSGDLTHSLKSQNMVDIFNMTFSRLFEDIEKLDRDKEFRRLINNAIESIELSDRTEILSEKKRHLRAADQQLFTVPYGGDGDDVRKNLESKWKDLKKAQLEIAKMRQNEIDENCQNAYGLKDDVMREVRDGLFAMGRAREEGRFNIICRINRNIDKSIERSLQKLEECGATDQFELPNLRMALISQRESLFCEGE